MHEKGEQEMKNTRTHRTLNKIRTALIGTAMVAAASYVSPADADMIFSAIGDDGTGPPGMFDGSITATANTQEAGGNRVPAMAIDGRGIIHTGGSASDRNNYAHDAGIDDNGDTWNYLSEAGDEGIGWFKVNLGASYPLKDAFFFNFNPNSPSNGNETRGLATANIYHAVTDPGNNTPLSGSFDNTGWTLLESGRSFTIAPTGDVNQTVPDVITFGGVNAQFVALEFLTNHGHAADYVGIGEIQFFIPEPSTFALLALGGFLIRRVRRNR
jgi:hypothetical protein